jgi:hypothetical protein
MKKSEKKEILLRIIESSFEDRTKDIDDSNCISFYHFLLNTLELEIFEIPEKEEATISICFSIIELLSSFHLLNIEPNHWSSTNTKNYLKRYSGVTEDEYQDSISKLIKIYTFIKGDYFLNLP